MRNLDNLKRLQKLKNEADKINESLQNENKELKETLDEMIEGKCNEFIREVKRISVYGSAGYTGVKLDFCSDRNGKYPDIIHKIDSDNPNEFTIEANPPGYGGYKFIYSQYGWGDWERAKVKRFIALHKDEILDAMEEKIAQEITKHIENPKFVNDNIKLKEDISLLSKPMKITNGTAIYTGGGNYTIIGKINNGLWFNGCNEWCAIFDEDTRTKNEDGELMCIYNEWCEKHDKTSEFNHKEIVEMFKDFCKRLDNNEEGITKGYEEFSNYIPGEVTDYIDFSEM